VALGVTFLFRDLLVSNAAVMGRFKLTAPAGQVRGSGDDLAVLLLMYSPYLGKGGRRLLGSDDYLLMAAMPGTRRLVFRGQDRLA